MNRARFRDFSTEQKQEWIRTYWAYLIDKKIKEKHPGQKTISDDEYRKIVREFAYVPAWMTNKQEYEFVGKDLKNEILKFEQPGWFTQLPEWEKEHWIKTMSQVMQNDGKDHDQVSMGPVVKKGGMPGLRNLAISSYATIYYSEFKNLETSVSPQTIRSSNVIALAKEGSANLKYEEAFLTESNMKQVGFLYDRIKEDSKQAFPWNKSADFKPITLYQTLLRMKGGGDDHVIDHKEKFAEGLNHDGQVIALTSNHCIGAPNRVFFWMLSLMGSNIQGTTHLEQAIDNFLNKAVFPTLQEKNQGAYIPAIKAAYASALKGQFDGNLILAGLKADESKSLNRVFAALSDYVKADAKKDFNQNYQLHEAALEEIIFQYTGNRIQSSCKSGKDREGVEKCYRNAMLAFYDQYGQFPPLEAGSKEREAFIQLFLEFFNSHHQARLAELNARGCNGLKALGNILPEDIYQAVKASGILEQHEQNSSLNELGKTKVKRDEQVYKKAVTDYSASVDRPMQQWQKPISPTSKMPNTEFQIGKRKGQ